MGPSKVEGKLIQVRVTTTEFEMLTWLAEQRGEAPDELLAGFVSDLTGSWSSAGSDERLKAFDWYKRRYGHVDAQTATAWRQQLEDHGNER